jgi:hypothetical protein
MSVHCTVSAVGGIQRAVLLQCSSCFCPLHTWNTRQTAFECHHWAQCRKPFVGDLLFHPDDFESVTSELALLHFSKEVAEFQLALREDPPLQRSYPKEFCQQCGLRRIVDSDKRSILDAATF